MCFVRWLINFMYQFDWVMGCSDIWIHIILGHLWECFWKRLAFEFVNWIKQMVLTHAGGHHPICWGPEWNEKVEEGRICFLCLTVELRGLSFPQTGSYSMGSPISQDFRLRLEWHHWLSWVSGLKTAGVGVHSLHNHVSQLLILQILFIQSILTNTPFFSNTGGFKIIVQLEIPVLIIHFYIAFKTLLYILHYYFPFVRNENLLM